MPTPQSHDSLPGYAHRVNRYGTKHGGRNLNDTVVARLTQRMQTPVADDAVDRKDGKFNSRGEPKLSAQVKMTERMPTPRAEEAAHSGRQTVKPNQTMHLAVAAKRMATPTAQDANGRDRHNQRDGSQTLSLLGQVRRVPKPTSQDAKNNCGPSQKDRDALNVTVGGALNPPWVEWLMGWPVGWTDLQPLAMDRFRQWLRSHGDSSHE